MIHSTDRSISSRYSADGRRGGKARTRILQAAADLFAKNGLNHATMSDVAAKAGVGKGTIYAHFKSKEDLFFSVFDHVIHQALETAKVQVTDIAGPPAQRLWAVNEAVLAGIRWMLPYYGLVLEFWSASSRPAKRERIKIVLREFYAAYRQVVGGLIEEGVNSGAFDPDVDSASLAAGLVGMRDALGLQAWFESDFDMEGVGRNFMTVFLNGLSRGEK